MELVLNQSLTEDPSSVGDGKNEYVLMFSGEGTFCYLQCDEEFKTKFSKCYENAIRESRHYICLKGIYLTGKSKIDTEKSKIDTEKGRFFEICTVIGKTLKYAYIQAGTVLVSNQIALKIKECINIDSFIEDNYMQFAVHNPLIKLIDNTNRIANNSPDETLGDVSQKKEVMKIYVQEVLNKKISENTKISQTITQEENLRF